jgi:MFS family permease
VLALLAARTVDECAGFLPTASFASFRLDLGLTYSQASLVLVLGAPGAIVGNVFPVLADHFSRRVIAAGGAFGYAGALFAFAFGRSFGVLACASFAIGFCATAVINGTELALVDIAGPDVTAYFARGVLFGTIGGLLGPVLLIAATATGFGWRGAFVVSAVVMVAYGTWLARLALPPPPTVDTARRPWHGLRPVLRDLHVWYCGGVALLVAALQQPFAAYLVAYTERDRGLSPVVATALLTGWVAGAAVAAARSSRVTSPDLARGLSGPAALLLVATAGALVAPWAPAIALSVALNGFAVTRMVLALKSRLVARHPGRVGGAFALVSTIEFAGFGLPLLAGRLADAYGVRVGLSFFVVLAAVLLIVTVAGDGVGARRDRQARSARAI